MNQILKTLRKHWTRVWLIAILLISGGAFVTTAVYTEVASVKRVVSTEPSPSVMFSSNCMRTETSSRRLTSSEYSITVCNFDQEQPNIFNPSTINYTLQAKLQVKTDVGYTDLAEYLLPLETTNNELYNEYVAKANSYFIAKTEDDSDENITNPENKPFNVGNGFSATFTSDSLAAKHSSVDKYKVKIDENAITSANTDIFVYVWAVPNDPLEPISTMLYGTAITANTASWTGTFIEQDCDSVDYDFYNYVITGSGEGTVDILWNPQKFSINDFFFDKKLSGNTFEGDGTTSTILENDPKYGSNSEHKDEHYVNWKKITLIVGGENSKSMYELQLYKTAIEGSLTGDSYTGDNAATKYIACYFNKKEQN